MKHLLHQNQFIGMMESVGGDANNLDGNMVEFSGGGDPGSGSGRKMSPPFLAILSESRLRSGSDPAITGIHGLAAAASTASASSGGGGAHFTALANQQQPPPAVVSSKKVSLASSSYDRKSSSDSTSSPKTSKLQSK